MIDNTQTLKSKLDLTYEVNPEQVYHLRLNKACIVDMYVRATYQPQPTPKFIKVGGGWCGLKTCHSVRIGGFCSDTGVLI